MPAIGASYPTGHAARGGFFFREAVSSPRLPPAWQRRIRPPEDRLLDDVLFAR